MRSAKDIEEEAAAWIARLDGKPPREWPPEFRTWLAADLKHQAAFTRLTVAWRRFDPLRKLRPLDRATVDEDLLAPRAPVHDGLSTQVSPHGIAHSAAVEPLHVRHREPVPAKRAGWRMLRPVLAIAALALIVVSVSWLVLGDLHSRVYETNVGGHERVPLEDGSVIELNTNTRIRVKFSDTRREIILQRGEALFTVAHQADRPFEVAVAGVTVQAVGTEFSVRRHDDRLVETLVNEGHVVMFQTNRVLGLPFGRHAMEPILGPGDRALVDGPRVSVMNTGVADVRRRFMWVTGRVEFRGETVSELVQELNRYSLHRIVILDPELGTRSAAGAFDVTQPESFVPALSSVYGADKFALID